MGDFVSPFPLSHTPTLRLGHPVLSNVLLVAGLLFLVIGMSACTPQEHKRAATMNPHVQELLRAGTRALARSDFRTALALADSAEAYVPKAAGAAFLRGRAYTKLLLFERAEDAYQEALRRDPDAQGIWHNLGNNALRREQPRRAITYFRKELERHPAALPWRGLGYAYEQLGRADSARISYRRALTLDSTYVLPHLDLARLYSDEGALGKALKQVWQALQLAPEHPKAHYLAGRLLTRLGRLEGALPHLQTAAKVRPWHASTQYNLGQALLRMGRTQEAHRHLSRAQKLQALADSVENLQGLVGAQPENPKAHVRLADALLERGRVRQALRQYKTALFLTPRDTALRYKVADALLEEGAYHAAIGWLRSVVWQDPTHVEAWVRLGKAYDKTGHRQQAERAWQAALRLDPHNPTAQQYLE